MKGIVKFFDPLKGYGFIEPDGDRNDHFVHRSELAEGVSLDKGDRVEFKSEKGERGYQALNVKKID
ncbi:MAG: cold shock domain-containing protein [Candidatus Thermoplasmatota archaeon]|nr:cold shock domain-containing protein [Candidatus Thermoplasmatota archaeon]MBS3790672.1 cold shock domain-containing protein [Candidatus Thermoplasmatota archaeon]